MRKSCNEELRKKSKFKNLQDHPSNLYLPSVCKVRIRASKDMPRPLPPPRRLLILSWCGTDGSISLIENKIWRTVNVCISKAGPTSVPLILGCRLLIPQPVQSRAWYYSRSKQDIASLDYPGRRRNILQWHVLKLRYCQKSIYQRLRIILTW